MSRGKDYIVATILITVVATFLNMKVVLILGLSMAVMGVASLALLAFASRKRVEISMDDSHIKAFKGEESSATVVVRTMAKKWLGSQVISFSMDNAQVTSSDSLGPDRTRLRLVGRYAGRSTKARAKIALSDPLRLFLRFSEANSGEFVLDILPDSLLTPALPRRLPIVSLGELPAGSPGTGQELYGLDNYHPFTDTKDIIWRRVARSPDATLIARIRESNVRDVVRIGIMQVVERRSEERSVWMDLVCESLGFLGKEIIQIGATLTISYQSGDRPVSKEVKELDDLAEAIMAYSLTSSSGDVGDIIGRSDLIVTGLLELEDPRVAMSILDRPALLISEKASPVSLGARSMVFSGKENLIPLMQRIMER